MKTTRREALVLAAVPLIPAPAMAAPVAPTRYVIMPTVDRIERQSKTRHDNCWTIHYVWMTRGTVENPFFGETTHVNHRRYAEWLAEGGFDLEAPGIPPHIQFGGAVVAGERDPMFYSRWAEYAAREFGHCLQKEERT